MIKTRKKRVVKTTAAQQKILNKKFFGGEPEISLISDNATLTQILNWYHYNIPYEEGYSFLQEYCQINNCEHLLKKTDYKSFSPTVYWLCRLFNRSVDLSSTKAKEYIDKNINKPFIKDDVISENVVKSKKENKLIPYIEQLLDYNNYSESIFDYINKNKVPQYMLKEAIDYYEPLINELKNIGIDKQITEAYKIYSKKQISSKLSFLQQVLVDCGKSAAMPRRIQRKPRTKKVIPVQNLLKTFKYQESDKNYNINSINPTKIVGSNEVWLYDTKYCILTKLVAEPGKSLSVKGTTIININEAASLSKKCGRKVDVVLNSVITGGKVVLRKIFDTINTGQLPPKTRTSENALILKVI